MKTPVSRRLLFDCAWVLGATVLVIGSGGYVASTVDTRRVERDGLVEQLRLKHLETQEGVPAEQHVQRMQELTGAASGWSRLTNSGSARIAQISSAASRSGVRVTGVEGLKREAQLGDPSSSDGHALTVVGGFAQVGAFLERLQAADGLIRIDEVELVPHEAEASESVQATLRAIWFAEPNSEGGLRK